MKNIISRQRKHSFLCHDSWSTENLHRGDDAQLDSNFIFVLEERYHFCELQRKASEESRAEPRFKALMQYQIFSVLTLYTLV